MVDVDPKDYEKGEKPKDENEEAKTKATMRPTRYSLILSLHPFFWSVDLLAHMSVTFRSLSLTGR